ncbi:MAG: LD-carboxypeptidase [Calditrichaeota bacterium]|nr:LD-carboxypeptidase [Calditrichota bacterium]
MQKRREFLNTILSAGAIIGAAAIPWQPVQGQSIKKNILPPALEEGDTVGLITPASSLFEGHRTLIEATEKMNALGFKVKAGKNIFKTKGYLAGSIEDRLEDIHDMFQDNDVKAIITIRGGYGSGQLLPYLDYELIRNHPKILVGYSDITSLLLGIYRKTGLVTFHGPVATSTFTDFTTKYFKKVLMNAEPAGEIDDAPYDDNHQTSSRIWTLNGGKSRGRLIGGNLSLMQATMGTPFEFESDGAIIFIEEVGEEPYYIDRIMNQFKMAGKFDKCQGVIFDKLSDVQPSKFGASFYRNLSVEEVITDYFKDYDFPVCVGFSLGHIKNKPTMPLGILAELDADRKKLSFLEAAVQN